MSNDKATNNTRHLEQTTATCDTSSPDPTPSTPRRAWHAVQGTWETTLAQRIWSARVADQLRLTPGATSAIARRDGAIQAPAMPDDLAFAFDATHVTRPGQVTPR
jgi:hypothetical protein